MKRVEIAVPVVSYKNHVSTRSLSE